MITNHPLRPALTALAVALAAALATPPAQAAADPVKGDWTLSLQPRDLDHDGTVDAWYDRALNISWLADASVGGLKSWAGADAWARGLNVAGVTGWRLPAAFIDGSGLACTGGQYGNGPCGYNPLTMSSEMTHLFYTTLGNQSWFDITGHPQDGWDAPNTGPFTGLPSTPEDLRTMQIGNYWMSQRAAGGAWTFDFYDTAWTGRLWFIANTQGGLRAWAVHDGDVGQLLHASPSLAAAVASPVPEVPGFAMLAAGLGLLALRRRRG